MEQKSSQWVAGYKEMRNYLHNQIGLTKDQIETIIMKITQDEIKHLLGENGEFIRSTIRQMIREEIMLAVYKTKYPKVERYNWNFDNTNKTAFNDFVSETLKEEIIEQLRGKFNVDVEIKKQD